MKWFRCIFILLCFLSGLLSAQAQERVWNAALDRYEFICRHCNEWRLRLERGESVPRDSLKAMTRELSEVRKDLQYALGDMSPGQRRRFEAIRDLYANGQWTSPAPSPILSPTDVPVHLEYCASQSLSLPLAGHSETASPRTEKAVASRAKPMIRPLAGFTIGVYPDLSYGLLAGITYGGWGFFIKGRSNLHTQRADYACLSDGTTEEGFFWSGDDRRVSRHQIAIDVSYAIWKPVSLYLGAGYGSRALCWKDSEDRWARVLDRSYRGPSLEAGLLIHPLQKGPARGLTLLLGVTWISRQYLDAEAGFAWRF